MINFSFGDLLSSKQITDDLSSLKIDVNVFPNQSEEQLQALLPEQIPKQYYRLIEELTIQACGELYIDDMVTSSKQALHLHLFYCSKPGQEPSIHVVKSQNNHPSLKYDPDVAFES
jgi:hypothetical protein